MLMTIYFYALAVLSVLNLCSAIKVPTNWEDNISEVNQEDFSVITIKPEAVTKIPIPNEYFSYTAKKPQYAIDIAKYHGVQSPENHYKSYAIQPSTGVNKPILGVHQMLERDKIIYKPFQNYIINENAHNSLPILSHKDYQPYKQEEPALQDIYKDPVLTKIRNDIYNSKAHLQNYESTAGDSNINKDEYLESPEETDRKKLPHKNILSPFEVHKPWRRPAYYRVPQKYAIRGREHTLNKKFRHPWNQHFVMVKPKHYRPLKAHLENLRQNHAFKYDDEYNQYPRPTVAQDFAEPSEGFDIYEKGKNRYEELKDNVDVYLNNAAQKNRQPKYQKLEMQNNNENDNNEKEEFVPIKNYAQVRKTETNKHLPRKDAFKDAESFDEVLNAPRLREAIKSTKAQTVYTEEGYEDGAYDHAGEQKHASENEDHGGYLKENEKSKGKFKTPSLSYQNDDKNESVYGDKVLHGKKWLESNKDSEKENKSEDHSQDENVYSSEALHHESPEEVDKDAIDRVNTENEENSSDKSEDIEPEKVLQKREINKTIESPVVEDAKIKKHIRKKKVKSQLRKKYPYYRNKDKKINDDSPLRYAENMKLIPKKTKGGLEFYESRDNILCHEVDDEVDPVPDHIGNNNTNIDTSEEFDSDKKKQRLQGLGDKIDCFKAKYFGKQPLDSPFFKETLISNPEPIKVPPLEFVQRFNSKNQFIKDKTFVPSNNTVGDIIKSDLLSKNVSESTSITEGKTSYSKRKKRSSNFSYEPYKIIKDNQSIENRKTFSNNNHDLNLKQKLLQNKLSDHNTAGRVYSHVKRIPQNDMIKSSSEAEFIDVNSRRGEPRYELKHSNHKQIYTPITDPKSITSKNYNDKPDLSKKDHDKLKTSHTQKYFDLSKYLPNHGEIQASAESKTYRQVIRTSTHSPVTTDKIVQKQKSEEEVREEYDDEEENETTTTSLPKILFRRKNKPMSLNLNETETPKLALRTRFRLPQEMNEPNSEPNKKQMIQTTTPPSPKYREKKRKSSKSTVVTDTKSYGEDDDDMRNKEIDAMIGVTQAMKEFEPDYDKSVKIDILPKNIPGSNEIKTHEKTNESEEISEENEDESSEESDSESDESQEEDLDYETTTISQTTTNRPVESTNEKKNDRIVVNPVVRKKKIEIHKESPKNKSPPNTTQYKQDIKEIEIIKESPSRTTRRKPPAKTSALELFKDDKLAEEVNKLSDVIVFKKDFDITNEPKHGGNYKNAKIIELIDDDSPAPLHGGNLKASVDIYPNKNRKTTDNSNKNNRMDHHEKYGKLSVSNKNQKNKANTNDKKSKLRDDNEDEETKPTPRKKTKNSNIDESSKESLEIDEVSDSEINKKASLKDNRYKAADLLNSYARAVPILTTAPSFIMDPGRRKYYYVDP